MAPKNQKTIILGPEYDEGTRRALKAVLLRLGATGTKGSWDVGGSQEIEALLVSLDGHSLIVESETYVGLTITGDEDLVDRVANLVAREIQNG